MMKTKALALGFEVIEFYSLLANISKHIYQFDLPVQEELTIYAIGRLNPKWWMLYVLQFYRTKQSKEI